MPKLHLRGDGAPIIRVRRHDDRDHSFSTYQVTPDARDWLRKRGVERDGDTVSHDEFSYLMDRGWIHTEGHATANRR
jgi:hypothetical protein